MRLAHLFSAGVAAAFATACLELAPVEESSQTGGGAGAATGGSGAAGGAGGSGGVVSSCDCGAAACACVPAAPSGWAYARFAGGDGSGCPTGFSSLELRASLADPGCAPCACGALTGSCTAEARWMGATCAIGPPYTEALTPSDPVSCQPNAGGADSVYLWLGYKGGGSCAAVNQALPLDAGLTVCTVAGSAKCEAGACVPSAGGLDATPCVVSEAAGSLACPAGYPKKQLLISSWSDTRVCSGCSCAAPSQGQVTCGSAAQPKVCTNCAGTAGCASSPWNSCVATGTSGHSVVYGGAAPAAVGTCTAQGTASVTSGSLVATQQRTVCCAG